MRESLRNPQGSMQGVPAQPFAETGASICHSTITAAWASFKYQLYQDPERSEREDRSEVARKVINRPNSMGKPFKLQDLHETQPVNILSWIREELSQPHPSTEDYWQSIKARGECGVFFSGVTTDKSPITSHPDKES